MLLQKHVQDAIMSAEYEGMAVATERGSTRCLLGAHWKQALVPPQRDS